MLPFFSQRSSQNLRLPGRCFHSLHTSPAEPLRCYVSLSQADEQTWRSPLRPIGGLLNSCRRGRNLAEGCNHPCNWDGCHLTDVSKSRGQKRTSAYPLLRFSKYQNWVSVTSLPPGVYHWAAAISNHFVIPLPCFSVDRLPHCTQTRVLPQSHRTGDAGKPVFSYPCPEFSGWSGRTCAPTGLHTSTAGGLLWGPRKTGLSSISGPSPSTFLWTNPVCEGAHRYRCCWESVLRNRNKHVVLY